MSLFPNSPNVTAPTSSPGDVRENIMDSTAVVPEPVVITARSDPANLLRRPSASITMSLNCCDLWFTTRSDAFATLDGTLTGPGMSIIASSPESYPEGSAGYTLQLSSGPLQSAHLCAA